MIVLTGFEKFGKFKINPSLEVVKSLKNKKIKYVNVPVCYSKAKMMAREIIKENIEGVISFGLADGRANISVEAVAINIMDDKKKDNCGYRVRREKIYKDGKDAYFSTLDFYGIVDELRKNKIPSYVSYSAGTYVCNTLFYSLLYYRDKFKKDIPIGFVHLPSNEDIVVNKINKPYVEFETMRKAAKIIIDFTFRHASL